MNGMTHACRSLVISGVSGSGKTTIGRALSDRLGWSYAEGDGFHPARNIELMRSGTPLTDADRAAWLAAIGAWVDEHGREFGAVVSCSALRRRYRDYLSEGRPWLRFCQLDVPDALLKSRIIRRHGHFMPVSLLDSQLEALEPLQADEPGIIVDGTGAPELIADHVIASLGLPPVMD